MPVSRRLVRGIRIVRQTAHKRLVDTRAAGDERDCVRGLACATHTAKLATTKVRTVWNRFSLLFEVDLI